MGLIRSITEITVLKETTNYGGVYETIIPYKMYEDKFN